MIALLAETDGQFRFALAECLERYGVAVEVVATGDAVLRSATDRDYSAIVLASRLPDYDATQLCRLMRRRRVGAPIIILRNGDDPMEDRIADLDSGADDCLTWPISGRELAARIHAVRRRGSMRESMLVCGDLTLDRAGHRAWRGEVAIDLSATEFALLEVLMRHRGEVLCHRTLLEQAWDGSCDRQSNVVPVYVRYLREKIDRPFGRRSLQTIRGVGYRLEDEDRDGPGAPSA